MQSEQQHEFQSAAAENFFAGSAQITGKPVSLQTHMAIGGACPEQSEDENDFGL